MKGHEAVVELLLASPGVDPDATDTLYGRTPLSYAAKSGHETIVKWLLATPEVKGHSEVIKTFLSLDHVNLDSKDCYGSSPLSVAVRKGHTEVVKILLATTEPIEIDSKDRFGRTPLWWAMRYGYADIPQLLFSNADKRGVSVSQDDLDDGHNLVTQGGKEGSD